MNIDQMIADAVNRKVQEIVERKINEAVEKALQMSEQPGQKPMPTPTVTGFALPTQPTQIELPLPKTDKPKKHRSGWYVQAGASSYLSLTNKRLTAKAGTHIAQVYGICAEALAAGPATRRDVTRLAEEAYPDFSQSTISSSITKFVQDGLLAVVAAPKGRGF
jgi:hypothetical protein